MSCRFATDAGNIVECDLLSRGGWEQLVAIERIRTAGVALADGSSACPVAARGQWGRCPCRRAHSAPMLIPVRL